MTVYQSEPQKSYPTIGDAYFPDSNLTLSVHDFRAGGDMGDTRYRATFGTEQVTKFIAALREIGYEAFGIKDNQGPVNIPCLVTVPEGHYKGKVTFIEIGQRESSYLGLRCWLNAPAVDTGTDSKEFHVTYRDDLWRAYSLNDSRGTNTLREVGYGLEELFAKCKAAGLTWDGCMNDEGINEIRDWEARVKPAGDIAQDLWRQQASHDERE